MVMGDPVDACEEQGIGVPERSRCRPQRRNRHRCLPCFVERQYLGEGSWIRDRPMKIDIVVKSACVEAAVRPLRIGESRGGFPGVPASDQGQMYLVDTGVLGEEVHVEAGTKVGLRIDGVPERGTLEKQDSRILEGAQEPRQFIVVDRGRTDAYAHALRARVMPDSVVLHVGASSGILTLLACQAGARKVFAVEQDGIIQVAREIAIRAAANRLSV